MALLIMTGCSSNAKLSDNFTIETKETGVCKTDELTKYYNLGDVEIYLSCLSNVYLKDKNTKVELKDYLSGSSEEFENKLNKVLSKLNEETVFYDGGTTVYGDNKDNRKTNNGITIVRCHTLSGDRNIYIGPADAELENYCNNSTSKKKYRIVYYRIWGEFYSPLSEDELTDYYKWVSSLKDKEENAKKQDEMLLVSFIKRYNITREEFDKCVEEFKKNKESMGFDLTEEEFEVPNADIIYTFDNDIINEYYKKK